MRFRLTPEERRARVSEGRWGWANPKRMSRKEFIGLRNRMYEQKKKAGSKKEEAMMKKEAERQRKEAAKSMGHAKTGPVRKGGRLKLFLIVVVLAIMTYLAIRYLSG